VKKLEDIDVNEHWQANHEIQQLEETCQDVKIIGDIDTDMSHSELHVPTKNRHKSPMLPMDEQ
jgi:hypothetical protein